MHEHESRLLRSEGLAFFGRVMAGQSHEVTNVLNVINELAGLQGDILGAAEPGRPSAIEKLTQIAEKIRDQVQRGETIVRSMNRFAHSVDCPVSVFDLKEALEQVDCLAQRSATLAKTTLTREFPAASMPLETSPFDFKQAVFMCIEIALTASSKERRITASYQVFDTGVEIKVASADPISPTPSVMEEQAYLALLMRKLGGKVSPLPVAEATDHLTLFFPRPAPLGRAAAGAIEDDSTEETHGN